MPAAAVRDAGRLAAYPRHLQAPCCRARAGPRNLRSHGGGALPLRPKPAFPPGIQQLGDGRRAGYGSDHAPGIVAAFAADAEPFPASVAAEDDGSTHSGLRGRRTDFFNEPLPTRVLAVPAAAPGG